MFKSYVRLVEGSTQTVIRPEVHVQPLVMYLVICPLYLAEVESSTYAVAHLKAPVQASRFVLEAKTHSSTCLRKLSHHCCSSCYWFFWCVCILPLHRYSLTCCHIMLDPAWNPWSHRDFKLHISPLSASWCVVLAHFSLWSVCIYCNIYRILCKISVFIAKKFKGIVLPVLAVLCYMSSRSVCILLRCCKDRKSVV